MMNLFDSQLIMILEHMISQWVLGSSWSVNESSN